MELNLELDYLLFSLRENYIYFIYIYIYIFAVMADSCCMAETNTL